jgi:hypothetical protein
VRAGLLKDDTHITKRVLKLYIFSLTHLQCHHQVVPPVDTRGEQYKTNPQIVALLISLDVCIVGEGNDCDFKNVGEIKAFVFSGRLSFSYSHKHLCANISNTVSRESKTREGESVRVTIQFMVSPVCVYLFVCVCEIYS